MKKNTEANPEIEKLVFSIIKTANCISKVAAELSFQLPSQELHNFKELFDCLDQNMKSLNITSYGISITTLEEVFLKVAEGNDVTKRRFSRMESETQKVDDFELNSVKIKDKTSLFFVHFWALIVKRLDYFKRDKKGLVCEIILPCIVVVLGLCLTLATFVYQSPALEMGPKILTIPMKIPVQPEYVAFYSNRNFPGGYFSWISENNNNDNTNVLAFDNFTFGQRNEDENGLYGGYFINITQPNKYSYLALVHLYKNSYIF